MFGQTDFVDEVEFGIKNLVGRMSGENRYQHADHAFDYDGIGISYIVDFAVAKFCVEPYTALATFNQAVGSFESMI